MDVNKYRALFIDEGREHVSEMSRLLVELEGREDRGPIVDEVFRHAHSIKSMAASMGYEPIATLAHRLEDVVGVIRAGKVPVASETVDVLLRSVDALKQQVRCIAEGQALEGHFDLVRELGSQAQALVQPGKSREGGPTVLRVRLSSGCPSPPLRAFLIYRRLSELAAVQSVTPSVEDMKAGRMVGHEIRFVFNQACDEAEARRILAMVTDVESVDFDTAEQAPAAEVPALTAAPATARAVQAEPDRGKALATVRVRADLLDDIMDSVGELFIVRERLRMLLGNDMRSDVRSTVDDLGARIRQIHDQVIAARMTPLRTLTDRYPRLVRDLCRTLNKDVDLEVRGRDIEIDRAVLDNLDAPLIHTLRNAVDHGIELSADRLQRGKPAAGKVVITAVRDRDTVVLTVEDDGAGLDAGKLRDVAVQRGVITPAAAQLLTPREAYFLICLPGFSTKSEVSDISGRGVGMDVVMARVGSVGGALDIDSELGKGTRFTFRLPVTLAIIPVLLVESAGRVFAVPVAKVVAVRQTAGTLLEQPDGSHVLTFNRELLPMVYLRELLQLAPGNSSEFVVVTDAGPELVGMGVDGIVGYREVVVKPLGEPLERLEWFSGASILGDGQPILILDISKTLRLRKVA